MKIKKIIEIIICVTLFAFLGYIGWQRSPLCSSYYFDKGRKLYNLHQYDASIRLFEYSLQANSKNSAARYFLVLALSKGTPTYSHQQSLYLMSNSKTQDNAQQYARTQVISLKKRLLEGLEDNYIYSAILNKDILRWNTESFPLKVYFDENKNIPTYYRDNIKKAMEKWMQGSKFIQFTEVFKEEESDIYIKFSDYNGDKCESANCQYSVATTTNTTDKYNRLNKMIINFYKANPFGENYTQSEIYNTALHEVGHALGITGHSDNPQDAMYVNKHKITSFIAPYSNETIHLTLRDLNTLALLYRLAPTITNMRGWFHENLYYAPLILGNENEILQKKLDEQKKYIEKYPNYCSGYINISGIYSSMGNHKLAKDALDKAEELATNDNERYIINYNRAILYFNNQDYQAALSFANDARQIKNDERINTLIEEISSMINPKN